MRDRTRSILHVDRDPFRSELRRQIYSWAPDVQALRRLLQTRAIEQMRPRTTSWVAMAFEMAGEPQTMIDLYSQASMAHPQDFMLCYDAAYSLVGLDPPRWEEAIRYYHRALGIRPGTAGIWRCLATALRETGDLDGAIDAFHKSIEHQGDHAPTHQELGDTLRLAGEGDAALAAYRRAVVLDPDLEIDRRLLEDSPARNGPDG